MNPLLSSQTNRESFAAMIAWGDEENTNSFYEPHLILQNTSESIGEKEARKVGAEFPPDTLSAPIAFRSRSLEENWRDDLSNHHGCCRESLGQVLKIWLWIFLKKSSNFRIADRRLVCDFKNAWIIAEKYHDEAQRAGATSYDFAKSESWLGREDSNHKLFIVII